MGLLTKRIPLPIGIHIAEDAVHLVQLERENGTFRLVAQASHPFEDADMEDAARRDEAAIKFVKRTLNAPGFSGRVAATCLPSDKLVIQHLRLPPLPNEELVKTLPWELEGKLPFSPKEAVIRHLVAGVVSQDNETKSDVIALAVPQSAVEEHTRMMAHAGVKVCAVGVEACAMSVPFGLVEEQEAGQLAVPRAVMVFHRGAQRSHVAIIRSGELVFVKEITMGGEPLGQELSETDGAVQSEVKPEIVTDTEDIRKVLAYEIESCIRYYASVSRGARVSKLILVGSIRPDAMLPHVLSQHLGLSVEVGNPLAITASASDKATVQPELAVAAGLALYGIQ